MLEHIKHTACPECGAEVKSESRFDKTVYGTWNEGIVFKCYKELYYIPNTNEIVERSKCQESKKCKGEREKARKFRNKIIGMAEKELSKDWAEKFIQNLNYLYIREA